MNLKHEENTKERLRENIRRRQRELDPGWVLQTSEMVQERLMQLHAFYVARIVCVYLPLWGEVRTNRIIERCLRENKLLCVPACDPESNCYRLARFDRQTEQTLGPNWVPQPARPVWLEPECVDFAVVPGLVFDLRCGRVGRGGGHFDTLLARMTLASMERRRRPFWAGLAFEFQIRERVPMFEHDIFMDAVVTEYRVILRSEQLRGGKNDKTDKPG